MANTLGIRVSGTLNKTESKKQINADIKELSTKLNTLKIKAEIDNSSIREINQTLAKLENLVRNFGNTATGNGSGKTLGGQLEKETKQATKSVHEMSQEASKFLGSTDKIAKNWNSVVKVMNKANGEATKYVKTITDAAGNQKTATINANGKNSFSETYKTKSIDSLVNKYNASIAKLEAKFDKLKTKYADVFDGEEAVKFQQRMDAIRRSVETQDKSWEEIEKDIANATRDTQKLENSLKGAQKASKDKAKADKESAKQMEREAAQARKVKQELAEAKQIVGTTKFNFASSLFTFQQAFSITRNLVRNVFEEIQNVDTAMTELKRVTSLTEHQYNSFMDGAAKKAESLGRTMTDYINATTEFSRAGFGQDGFENVEKMAETAMILQSVSEDLTANQASEYLVAAVRAYGYKAEDAIKIVDKLDNVANKESITIGGLGEAIEKAGSSLASANNTVEESIALITAANTVVQNPANVGTAFRTIGMRMRGIADLGDETGENSDSAEMALIPKQIQEGLDSINKKYQLNIQLMNESKTEFRSTYDVLLDLAENWNKLNDKEQSFFTEKMAGKTRANVLSALLNNVDILKRAYNEASDSDGAAMAEMEKRLKSVQAHVNELYAAWQNFATNTATVEFVNSILDLARGLLDAATNAGALNVALGGMTGMFTMFGMMNDVPASVKQVAQALMVLDNQTAHTTEQIASAQNTMNTFGRVGVGSFRNVRAAGIVLGNTVRALISSFGMALVAGLAIAGIVTAFKKVYDWVNNTKHAVDNLEDSISETKDKIGELQSKYDEINGKEVKTQYDERQLDILQKQIDLEQRKLELQEQQKNAQIVKEADTYFNDKDRLIDSEFMDNADAVKKATEAYKENQEVLQTYPEKIQQLKAQIQSTNSLFSGNLVTELRNLEEAYNKALNNQSGIYDNLTNGLGELYTERERLLSVVENGTQAERQSALASLAKLDAMIREAEQAAGLAKTIEDLNNEYADGVQKHIQMTKDVHEQEESYKQLSSAVDAWNSGQSVSREIVEQLEKEYPELTDVINQFGTESNGAFTLSKDGVAQLSSVHGSAMASLVSSQNAATIQAINNVNNRIEAYKEEIRALNLLYDAQRTAHVAEMKKQLDEFDKENVYHTVEQHKDSNGKVWETKTAHYKGGEETIKKRNELAKQLIADDPLQQQLVNSLNEINKLNKMKINLGKNIKVDYAQAAKNASKTTAPETEKEKDKDKNGSHGGGGRDKETERSTEIWDEYGEKINRVNENLKQFDSLISDANDKISYQDALIEAEGFTEDIYKDQIQTQKELIKHIQDKKEAEELYIDEVSKDYESFMKQIQEAAKAKKIEVGVDFSDVDLDKFLTEYKNTFKDSNSDEVTIMGQIVEAAKTARQWISDADNTVLQLSKDLIQQTAKEWEIDIKYKTNMLDQFSQSRELAQTIYDALSDCVGAEKLRKDIADQLIQSYKDENDAILDVYQDNLNKLAEIEVQYGKNSGEYKSAAKVYLEENNKIHQQAIKNIQSEFALRKQALQDQLEADKKAAERNIYGTTQSAYEREVNKEKKAIQDQIDALRKEADEKDAKEEAKKLQEELEEKEKELADLKIKLDNLNNQRTVRQLTRMDDGSWQWQYVTDQRKIAEAQEEIANKEKEINDTKNKIAKKADEDALENRINALQAQIDAMDKDLETKQEMYQLETESLEEACNQQTEILNKQMQTEIENYNKRTNAAQEFANNYKNKMNSVKQNMETANKEQAEQLGQMQSNWNGTMHAISSDMDAFGQKIRQTLAGIRQSIDAAKEAMKEAESMSSGGSTSAASGYRFVEANNMPFRLHYGERVLTRQEAERYNQIEDEIKSGAVEDMIRNAKNESLNTISTVAGSSVKLSANAVPSTTNNATSFVIENISLPNVQNAMDFAKEIQAWAANEFGTLRQRATARLAK